jgi:hypothetical protein
MRIFRVGLLQEEFDDHVWNPRQKSFDNRTPENRNHQSLKKEKEEREFMIGPQNLDLRGKDFQPKKNTWLYK